MQDEAPKAIGSPNLKRKRDDENNQDADSGPSADGINSVLEKKVEKDDTPTEVVEEIKVMMQTSKEEPPVKRPKPILYAKSPKWKDIPDWGGRDVCPIMDLPMEVMDMCFGYRKGDKGCLKPRDYISLCGVSKFFRHHLDDDFFHELGYKKEVRVEFMYGKPPKSIANGEAPSTKIAQRPFSRDIQPWYTSPPRHKIPPPETDAFFVPKGSRSKWTKTQYTRYKLERDAWMQDAIKSARQVNDSLKQEADNKVAKKSRLGRYSDYIKVNGRSTMVYARIKGRYDGQPAVEKDCWGIPLTKQPHVTWIDGREDPEVENIASALWSTMRASLGCQSDSIEQESTGDTETYQNIPKPRLCKKIRENEVADQTMLRSTRKWTVPAQDDDSDQELPLIVTYDGDGKIIPHDHWPSKWRAIVADEVNQARISKTDAMREFKVSEAELFGLRHVLVRNPNSSTAPKQLFSKAAVEALALRSHGGVSGHESILVARKQRSDKIRLSRSTKRLGQKLNGTFKFKLPECRCPRWEKQYCYGQCLSEEEQEMLCELGMCDC